MHSGRKFFLVLTALVLLGAILAGASPAWAQYVNGPKLTIINNSGYPASQVYLVFLARTVNLDGNTATGDTIT